MQSGARLSRGKNTLIFAEEKGAICVVYLSPLSGHDRIGIEVYNLCK